MTVTAADRFADLLGAGRGSADRGDVQDAASRLPLSAPALAVLVLAGRLYRESGFMYHGGAVTPTSLAHRSSVAADRRDGNLDESGFRSACRELVDRGLLERRGCKVEAYQLPAQRRAELIDVHGLAARWQANGAIYRPNGPDGEVTVTLRAVGRTNPALSA